MSEPEDPGGAGDYRVVIADEQSRVVDSGRLGALAGHALSALGVPPGAELSLVLAGPERMAELKGAWLGEPVPTDVLAFPMDGRDRTAGQLHLVGDVVLCPEVAERQAADAHRDPGNELDLLLVHGVLHLFGHDHAEPEETASMQAEERRILETFAAASR